MVEALAVGGSGGSILLELVPMPEVVAAPNTEGTAGVVDMALKLSEIGETIGNVCLSVQRKTFEVLQNSKPDSFELEFGITLAGETGIPLVAKGSAECTIKVTAKWGD